MSNSEIQLVLFRDAPEAISEAITKLKSSMVMLPNFQEFILQLGTKITSLPRGSVILAGVPLAVDEAELCSALRTHLKQAHGNGIGPGQKALASFAVQPTPNRKSQERMLYQGYSTKTENEAAPDFLLRLDYDGRPAGASTVRAITSVVSSRESTEFYVLTRAHFLQRAGAPFAEVVETLRTVIHIAQETRRTQVLIGSLPTITNWLQSPEIAESTAHCVLRPYSIENDSERANFLGVLAAYDSAIPWEHEAMLGKNAAAVHDAIAGCPYRLQKWILEALLSAQANGDAAVTWMHFKNCAPLLLARKNAGDELTKTSTLRVALSAENRTHTERSAPKNQFKPSRKRPEVGFDDGPTAISA